MKLLFMNGETELTFLLSSAAASLASIASFVSFTEERLFFSPFLSGSSRELNSIGLRALFSVGTSNRISKVNPISNNVIMIQYDSDYPNTTLADNEVLPPREGGLSITSKFCSTCIL